MESGLIASGSIALSIQAAFPQRLHILAHPRMGGSFQSWNVPGIEELQLITKIYNPPELLARRQIVQMKSHTYESLSPFLSI